MLIEEHILVRNPGQENHLFLNQINVNIFQVVILVAFDVNEMIQMI